MKMTGTEYSMAIRALCTTALRLRQMASCERHHDFASQLFTEADEMDYLAQKLYDSTEDMDADELGSSFFIPNPAGVGALRVLP